MDVLVRHSVPTDEDVRHTNEPAAVLRYLALCSVLKTEPKSEISYPKSEIRSPVFSIHDQAVRLCDRISRRELLRVGGLSTLGLSLPTLLEARERGDSSGSGSIGRAKNVLFLWLQGGPPQHETFDPKPDAPAEVRGEFRPEPAKSRWVWQSPCWLKRRRPENSYLLLVQRASICVDDVELIFVPRPRNDDVIV